jgi:hypothetical protein
VRLGSPKTVTESLPTLAFSYPTISVYNKSNLFLLSVAGKHTLQSDDEIEEENGKHKCSYGSVALFLNTGAAAAHCFHG